MKTSILGIYINVLNSYEEAYKSLINATVFFENKGYITVNNVHTVIEGVKNKKYAEVINGAFLSLPDGKPLSVVAKLKGVKNMGRIFGPTFMEKTIAWGQKENLKHFFFGSSKETLGKLLEVINSKYPQTNIVGTISPPFRKLTEVENNNYIQEMNKANPDIIWVGLGAPKQEIWMYENYKKLNRGIMIGIGAGFDYLAGNTKHAPKWMKDYSLEWFYRLLQEPGRLWKRYLITNSLFVIFIILELLNIKKFEGNAK